MSPLQVHPTNILTSDFDYLISPPPLMNGIHYPFRNPSFSNLQPPLQSNPKCRQPPKLLLRQCKLRQCGNLLFCLLGPLLNPVLDRPDPQLVILLNRLPSTGQRNGVLRRAPTWVKSVANPVFGQVGRQRNKDFARGVAVGIVLRVVSLWRWTAFICIIFAVAVVSLWWWSAFICIIFAVAEAAELFGDSFDGGFG